MDILAHGLYGGAAFVNKSKKTFWWAFWWGIFPDLSAFGLFFPTLFLTYGLRPNAIVRTEPPKLLDIPLYIQQIYNYSHSIIIFSLIFILVWALMRRPAYVMLPWALHIVMDIPSHTDAFFPTPFLYPLSSLHVNGIRWSTPWFFFGYWGLLAIIYGLQFWRRKCSPHTIDK